MPALPPVPTTLRIQLLWTLAGGPTVSSTTYWNYSGGTFTDGTAQLLAEAVNTALGTTLEPAYSADVTMTGIRVTDLSADTGGDYLYEVSKVGTRSGAGLPWQVCVLANYGLERRYRGGKPKNFLPWGVDGDLQTEGTWSAAAVTEFETVATDMLNDITGVNAGGVSINRPVTVSYYKGFVVDISPSTGRARNRSLIQTPPQTYNVTGVTVNPKIGTQRRRVNA